jgi:hypothetical protein
MPAVTPKQKPATQKPATQKPATQKPGKGNKTMPGKHKA